MKKIQKIASIFMSLGIVASAMGCANPRLNFEDPKGRWFCQYTDETRTECAVGRTIGGWGADVFGGSGKTQYVFYPSHIAGVPVTTIGFPTLMNVGDGKFPFSGGKHFLSYTVKYAQGANGADEVFVSGKNLDPNDIMQSVKLKELPDVYNYYVPNKYFDMYRKYATVEKANVVYDINYENEEYQYHSVDNYKYGSLIEIIPPDPEREGYTFDGWYKESECINKWNFETETLPEEIKDESGSVMFQETALYAKWKKYT